MELRELESILNTPGVREQNQPSWAGIKANTMLLRYKRSVELSYEKVVLDLCCGTGWGTYKLAEVARRVCGIDINPTCIEYAKLKWYRENCNYICMNIHQLEFDSNYFDIVVFCDAIEHFVLSDLKDNIMKGVVRVLCPEGTFCGSTPTASTSLQARQLLRVNRFHKHIFFEDELRDFLSSYFREVEVRLLTSDNLDLYFVCRRKI